MLNIILSSFVIMLASLIGVGCLWQRLGNIIEKNLHYLVSFSAGVFAIIAYDLAHETLEHSSNLATGIVWIAAGIALSLVIFRLLPHFHHHHDDHAEHNHSQLDARRILASDALHNIGDGILLAGAFSVNIPLGIATAVSIFIHEVIQEISEFFVLRQAGWTTRAALTANFAVSGTILIGALGGFFLLEYFEALEAALLGITAGAFLVVVIHDLIPHSLKSIRNNAHVVRHVSWFIGGLVLISLVGILLPHLH